MKDFEMFIGRGFIGKGLISKLLVGRASKLDIIYDWILSRSIPQIASIRGIWIDTSQWVDSNIWYD
jgi:hypothetical protein